MIIVASALIGYMYRYNAIGDLKAQAEQSNIILTKAISNAILPEIISLPNSISKQVKDYDYVDEIMSQFVSGTTVLKVKAFDLERKIIYSTQRDEIGIVKDETYGSAITIKSGDVMSNLRFRKEFFAIGGKANDIHVLSTYIPIYDAKNGKVNGAFEIYTNVTGLYERIIISQISFMAGVILIFGIIYIILYSCVRGAEKVIIEQANERESHLHIIEGINKDLQLARDEAMKANSTKSKFLANMSHELRTPLNAIIGYSEILEEDLEELSLDKFIPDLQRINGAGQHLLKLIDGVLDLSKVEAGKMELYVETIDIASVINDVVTTLEPSANKNGNKLSIKHEGKLGEMSTDVTKLRQLLFNIAGNALKFTQDGEITITVKPERELGFIEFRVSDTGIGMTKDQIEKLFQPFTQADVTTTRKYGGTGLGLTISLHFCEMMGGSIDVESEPGKGTVFIIHLPTNISEKTKSNMIEPKMEFNDLLKAYAESKV